MLTAVIIIINIITRFHSLQAVEAISLEGKGWVKQKSSKQKLENCSNGLYLG